jgi:nucleotide-binding universal stress UspA family protein
MGLRLVVGLDGSEYSACAVQMACQILKRYGGTAVGVAVVDVPAIEASSRGAGIGAYEYARRVREERMADANARASAFLSAFKETCDAAGAACELALRCATPWQAIVDESRYADMIVAGLKTYFHFETQDTPGDTLRHLMRVSVCPVLAVPRQYDLPTHSVLAMDGSLHAARALRAFLQLPASGASRRSMTLLHVGEGGREDHMVQIEAARKYVAGYGVDVTVEQRQGHPHQVIEQVAEERAPSVIVLGAYGHQGRIRDLLFGSTAAKIIAHERFPVFVYH